MEAHQDDLLEVGDPDQQQLDHPVGASVMHMHAERLANEEGLYNIELFIFIDYTFVIC